MRKTGHAQMLVVSTGLMFSGCSSDTTNPPSAVVHSALTANGVDVSLALTSDWTAGYCADVTLKNNSSTAVTNWSIVVQLNQSTLAQSWGVTSTLSSTQMTAAALSYDQNIAAGASVSFGFCGTATGTTYRPTLVSATVAGGGQSNGAGGAASTGGANATGGAASTGGAIATGGAASTGGAKATGGSLATGGAKATGGSLATGGAKATGGSLATGGAKATGGTTSSGARKFVGNIDTNGSIRTDFATYWNQFSPENAGKWGSVQPSSQSLFSWSGLDAAYNYCNSHNIIFKEHNFIWGAQQPSWTSSLTTATGPAAVQNWMKSFCTRYPNTKYIDVVNEPPPHTSPAYMNAIGGTGSSGYDWIVNAFKWARAACPNATLILNDYNIIDVFGRS